MKYQRNFDVSRPREALVRVADELRRRGFTADTENEMFCRLSGPPFRSTKQDPVKGISTIELRADAAGLELSANIDRVVKLFLKVLGIVFLALVLIFGAVSAVIEMPQQQLGYFNLAWLLAIGGNVLMWMLLMPFIGWIHRRKAVRALEDLVRTNS